MKFFDNMKSQYLLTGGYMLKCGIIGLGRIGSLLEDDTRREKPASHAGVIDSHPECELRAGCDIDGEKNNAFKIRWNCSNTYSDYDLMLKNEKLNIVAIATPPETHLEICRSAVKYNVDVIVLEKPVAHSIDQANEIADLVSASNSKVIINHERRYSLQYRNCKKIIDDKLYGDLVSIKSTLYMGRNRELASMLYDDGTHMIDLIHYLSGSRMQIMSVSCDTNKKQFYCTGTVNNTMFCFEAGSRRDHLVFEIDLSFENGRITVGNGYYHEFNSIVSPFYDNYKSLQMLDVKFPQSKYFSEMFKDAVRCAKNRNAVPVSTVKNGVEAITVIEQMIKFLLK
jgi:predicted dehydrogenase